MTALKALAGQRRLLLVGDSKLVSCGNLLAVNRAQISFIAPAATPTYPPASWLGWSWRRPPRSTTWPSETRARRPSSGAATGSGGQPHLAGQTQGRHPPQGPLGVRVVLGADPGRRPSRAKKLDRARADLERLRRGLGRVHDRTPAKVAERVATIARSRKVRAFLGAETGTDPATGKPTLSWAFDQAALQAQAATDGWYGL